VLNGNRAQGLWNHTAPPAPEAPVHVGGISVDVAIVGAGYTGLSAALYLAQHGAKVVVLEAETVGFGAAGRSTGLVNAGLWLLPDELAARLGPEYGERLLALLADAPRLVLDLIETHGIQCELERSGTLQCAVDARGLQAIRVRAEQWIRRGAPVELLDAHTTARKVGSASFCGALLDKRTGTIQPLAYVRGLARAAIEAGASVYTRSPVIALAEEGTHWRVWTPNGHALAHWVIVATDAYTRGLWPTLRREFTYLPYFNVATRPLDKALRESILPERQGMTDTGTVMSSVRLDQAGRLIVGSIGALRGTGSSVHMAWAKRTIRKLFPQVTDVELEYAWHGSIGMTDTHLPRFHRPAPQVLSISGYNGRGIAAGTVFGRLLGKLILDEIDECEMPLPLTEPRDAKFRNVRSLYYSLGSQIAHLADARIG
jgi:glycine/D-amino acid oxidase-like deaminating enzyme